MRTLNENAERIIKTNSLVRSTKQTLEETCKKLGIAGDINSLNLEALASIICEHALSDLSYVKSLVSESYLSRTVPSNVVKESYAEIQNIEGDTVKVDLCDKLHVLGETTKTGDQPFNIEDSFTQRVTANGTEVIDNSYAEIQSIEGNTVKCENLLNCIIDISDMTKYMFNSEEDIITSNASGGSTLINSDKFIGSLFVSIILYSKPTTSSSFTFYDNTTALVSGFENIQGYNLNQIYTINVSISTLLKIRLWGNSNVETFKFRMWINKDSAKDYQPFFSGLKNSKVTTLTSEGKNLLNIPDVSETTINGVNYSAKNGIIVLNGTATSTFILDIKISPYKLNGNYYFKAFEDYDLSLSLRNETNTKMLFQAQLSNQNMTTATSGTIQYLRIYCTNGTTLTNCKAMPMLVLGSTAPTTFEPYKLLDTLPLNLEVGKWQTVRKAVESDNVNTPYILDDNSGTIVLNGTESYNFVNTNQRNSLIITISDLMISWNGDLICDNPLFSVIGFNSFYSESIDKTNSYLLVQTNGQNRTLYINLPTSVGTTKEELVNWIVNNNLTIRYQTATHTYTSLSINGQYTTSNGGNETITNDNDVYGAIAKLDIKYSNALISTKKSSLTYEAKNSDNSKSVTFTLPETYSLRSIGEVHDTIDFSGDCLEDVQLTQRIGVRDYCTGDESDATILTDNINSTLYVLDNPIVTSITSTSDVSDKRWITNFDGEIEKTSHLINSEFNSLTSSSKNLLNIQDVPETTVNGLTYFVKDGAIYINGTAISDMITALLFKTGIPTTEILKEGQTLKWFYENLPASTSTTFRLGFQYSYNNFLGGDGNTYLSLGCNFYTVALSCKSGMVFNNSKFMPMLVSGTVAPTKFEKYFSNKISIDFEKAYKLAQILDIADVAETTRSGVTYKEENGTITLNGTSTNSFEIALQTNIQLNGTYTLQYFFEGTTSNMAYPSLSVIDSGVNLLVARPNTISATSTITTIDNRIRLYFISGVTLTNFIVKPMLVSGSTAPTTFQQYFDSNKVISTISSNLEVGKWQKIWKAQNLLNIADKSEETINGVKYSISNGIVTLNGTSTETANYAIWIPLLTPFNALGIYRFNKFEYTTDLSIHKAKYSWADAYSFGTGQTSNTYKTNILIKFTYISIWVVPGITYTNYQIKPMLVEGTTVPTTYLPYVTTPYILDDNSGTYTFTGDENWRKDTNPVFNKFSCNFNSINLYNHVSNTTIPNIISSDIQVVTANYMNTETTLTECLSTGGRWLYVRSDDLNATIGYIKNYMAGKTIRYQTATHTYIPLDLNLQYKASGEGLEVIDNYNGQFGALTKLDTNFIIKN